MFIANFLILLRLGAKHKSTVQIYDRRHRRARGQLITHGRPKDPIHDSMIQSEAQIHQLRDFCFCPRHDITSMAIFSLTHVIWHRRSAVNEEQGSRSFHMTCSST